MRHLVGVTEPALIRRELAAVADRMLTEAQRSDFTVAVTEIVTRTLEDLAPDWPVADFDVEEMKKALLATAEEPR